MRTSITVTALTAALLVSTAAYANETSVSAEATIESLPARGTVSLNGTVDRIVDEDTFVLRDSTGETIDIHTSGAFALNEGDSVSVRGEKTSKIVGIGREIKDATVSVRTDSGAGASLHDAPKVVRDNTEAKKTSAYDMDAAEAAQADASAKDTTITEDIKNAASSAADKVSETVSNISASDTATATAGTIASLPKKGSVQLSGTVDRVRGENKFVLRDAAGKTIDVHTESAVDVQPGSTVRVNGNMTSELLGFGRQIEAAQVLEISTAQ